MKLCKFIWSQWEQPVIKSLHQTSCMVSQDRYLKTMTVFETLWPECLELLRSFCGFVWYKCLVESVMVPTSLKNSCSGRSSLFSWYAIYIVSSYHCRSVLKPTVFPYVLLHSCPTALSASGPHSHNIKIQEQDTRSCPPGGDRLEKRTSSSKCWYDLVLVPRCWPALWKAWIMVKFCLSPPYPF